MYGKEITLDEMKSIELNIMKEIHQICEDQGFRYSLCGGTLLGAVRHGGFIPWDDDIDIIMPRPDYNKFIDYCKNNSTNFKIVSYETEKKYNYLFAKAMNRNTVIVEHGSNRGNLEMGIFVDIFPVDGLADSYEDAKKKYNESKFARELLVAYNWKKYFRSKTRSIVYEPIRLGFFIISRFINPKKTIAKINRRYDVESFEGCEYAGSICGSYRLKEIMPKSVYSEYTSIAFEDCSFRVFKSYDEYLTKLYGDYMKLPPKEHQVTHHMFDAYYKN